MRACIALALVVVTLAMQPDRRSISLIVVGGTVITEDPRHSVVAPGAVAIDGTDIVEIGAPDAIAAKYRGAETIEARDQIVCRD